MDMERVSLGQVQTDDRFIKIPKAFSEDVYYSDLSTDSRYAYGILRDRFKLSIKNKWIDDAGNVFLYYTNEKLGQVLNCGKDKVIKIKKELTKFGLLEEERQGLNLPNRLYIGNVISHFEVIHRPETSHTKEVGKTDYRKSEIPTTGSLKNRLQEVGKFDTNKTEYKETEYSEKEEDDLKDINNKNQNSFQKIAENISAHPELRELFLEITPRQSLNDPQTGLLIVEGLVKAEDALNAALNNGNDKMLTNQIIFGDQVVMQQLKTVVKDQLDYMANHLSDPSAFGTYFKKGLSNRISIWLDTASLTGHHK